ncbi:Ig-like domain-containing protein [Leptospira biflexa]|uniref:Ig-like domain-containing protein n=1 Tax=Leptospira biflexa TaxID=172 RepID=UPI0010824689|nr:Ig-like domain-containing protein [Leptospira biflexa]TGM31901.1 hypothetical protein EHQ89_16225 [Leptospira biflexa]TGM37043.1 hypothetical protein EHQ80_05430 [Leptospira biflexa]
MMRISLTIFFLFTLSTLTDCYYNPIVNSLLNPPETKENNSALALLGLPGASLLITGQIRYSNGVAEVGLELQPGKSFAPQSKSTTASYTTDEGGRFYIPYQTGSIPFTVYKNGSYLFEFSLEVVSPMEISFTSYGGGPNLEINGLGTIDANAKGNFFELVKAYFINGSEIYLHQSNFGATPTTIYLDFNEPPASIDTDITSWIQNSVIFTPPLIAGYTNLSVSGNQITLTGAEQITSNTQHTIDFTSNIKSASGKSLRPQRYSFYFSL